MAQEQRVAQGAGGGSHSAVDSPLERSYAAGFRLAEERLQQCCDNMRRS